MFHILSHTFRPSDNTFRHSFNLTTCKRITVRSTDFNDKDLKLNSYAMKWESVGNVRKQFNSVVAACVPLFGMLSVSIPGTLFTDEVTADEVRTLIDIHSYVMYEFVQE